MIIETIDETDWRWFANKKYWVDGVNGVNWIYFANKSVRYEKG